MSWHFSQALVEAYSAANSSGGLPCALSSGSHTHALYCAPDRMKAFSRLSRFGMMCEPLTESRGADVLTWCLAGSPAKTFPQPERAQESTENAADCGRTWHASFVRWDRDSRLWRTAQCSLLEGLDVYSETWPQWGMMRGGECSERTMPALHTSGTESGLWRSPAAHEPGVTIARLETRTGEPVGSMCRHYDKHTGRMAQIGLTQQVQAMMWPTPKTPSGGADNSANKTRPSGHKGTTNLLGAVKMWPTPQARDWKDSGDPAMLAAYFARRRERGDPEKLASAIGGQLNPTWVEWLMGWPLGWTDLKPLEMDKYQQWLRSHGKS